MSATKPIAPRSTPRSNPIARLITYIRRRRLPADLRAEYAAYMRSPQWSAKRRQVLARAGHKCQRCGATDRPLAVHHLNYRHFKRERYTDLIALCHACHQEADAERAAAGRQSAAQALAAARARGIARARRKKRA